MKKILFLLIIVVFCGCEQVEIGEVATQYTKSDIIDSPNFYWYQSSYDEYNINTALRDSISERFNKDELKIIIYTAPSCFCGSSYTKFPQLMKVLDSSNISESNYEIYVVRDNGDTLNFEHPYSSKFEVKTTPSFFLLKSEVLYYSLLEDDANKNVSVEQALLDGLKFFYDDIY